MNYHQYYPVDIVNGPGTRCTLFVSGCVHECPGCYNKSTWRVNSGQPFTKEMEDQIINDLNDTRIKRQGISLSGGDPLRAVTDHVSGMTDRYAQNFFKEMFIPRSWTY